MEQHRLLRLPFPQFIGNKLIHIVGFRLGRPRSAQLDILKGNDAVIPIAQDDPPQLPSGFHALLV